MKYRIADLLDIPQLQVMLDNLYAVSGIPSAIIDLEGKILTGSGWQDVCTKFHRVNPVTERFCIESDRKITEGVLDMQRHVQISCPLGLTDTATPLIIEGIHLANIFTGQLFLVPPDRGAFRRQAERFGFDPREYLAAVDRVPVITQEKLDENLSFIAKLTELLANQGLTQLRSLEVQERLGESEERLKQIIASAREGIIVYGKDLRFQVWNRYMEQISGRPAEEVLGKHPRELFAFLDTVGVVDRVARTLAGESVDTVEFQFQVPGGRAGWASDTCAALKNADGEIVGAIGTVRDITEHKNAEEQLRHALKMESVGRLAGGVAHDFNNMLTVILGQAELAKLAITPDHPLWPHLEQISRAGIRSSNITRQLLAFSRKEIIDPKPVDLNRLITEAQKMLLRLIEEDISLSCEPAPDLWTVKVDPSQIDQILVNLAVNARDAMPEGGTLSLRTANVRFTAEQCPDLSEALPGEYVLLTVSDTGTGMEKEVLDHIFEPFFTTKETGRGTGLGLATVYGIVSQNGGFIVVDSLAGEGTTFRVYLPRYRQAFPIPALQEEASLRAGTGRILLVEDNQMVRNVTTLYLERLGYRVVEGESPAAAIEICTAGLEPIDLVLTDVIMPGMSGKEMLDRIKARRPEVKALFMSGYTADLVAKRGVVEEGMHFIQKPFDIITLGKKIAEALNSA